MTEVLGAVHLLHHTILAPLDTPCHILAYMYGIIDQFCQANNFHISYQRGSGDMGACRFSQILDPPPK